MIKRRDFLRGVAATAAAVTTGAALTTPAATKPATKPASKVLTDVTFHNCKIEFEPHRGGAAIYDCPGIYDSKGRVITVSAPRREISLQEIVDTIREREKAHLGSGGTCTLPVG